MTNYHKLGDLKQWHFHAALMHQRPEVQNLGSVVLVPSGSTVPAQNFFSDKVTWAGTRG
jgi:hypothetical protein